VAAGHRSDRRILPLHAVPRAIVGRDTRGMAMLDADADTSHVLGLHAVAQTAGERAGAGVDILSAGMTVDLAPACGRCTLTIAEAINSPRRPSPVHMGPSPLR
jgi:mercuric reductase